MSYYVLNTNWNNSPEDDKYMLQEQKAAAFFAPAKYSIEKFQEGDIVFLYRSGKGIVAAGTAGGIVVKRSYQNDDTQPDEEYCQFLSNFKNIPQPLTASKIKAITGANHVFHRVMFPIDDEVGRKLYAYVERITH